MDFLGVLFMPAGLQYKFGPYRLDRAAQLLFRGSQRITLTPKAIEVLSTLVDARGSLVEKQELLRKVWADVVVEEGTLAYHISLLRKALGEGPGRGPFIETIPKRGYRFAGTLKESRPLDPFTSGKVMLAVLPLENLSGRNRHDYFSDGVAEELITQLARLNPERLAVIARTSAMQYRSSKKAACQIGRELGVSYLLQGSVRRSGRRVRIAVQLIKVSDETHLWAQSYERNLNDILTLQHELARTVAAEIQVKLTPQTERRLAARGMVRPEAYEAYLRGRYLLNLRTRSALRKSVGYFKQSIEHDPRFTVAYCGLADSYLVLQDFGYLRPSLATRKARAAADGALGMENRLAEVHTSMGHAHFHEFDWPATERELQCAIDVNPNYTDAHFYYSNYLVAMGRSEEAIAEARSALALDPVSLPAGCNLAYVLVHADRIQEAIQESLRVLEIDCNYARAYEDLGRAYEVQGKYPQALAAFEKAVASSGRGSLYLTSLAHAWALAGRKQKALNILRELRALSESTYVSPFFIALVYAGLGDASQAVGWLEKAYRMRDHHLCWLTVNPRLKLLHPERRFRELLLRMKFPVKPTTREYTA
jgi:TolB-like protein/Flp pilus assembly protein TadD